ncbi:dephospho-CoA kinase [Sinorhizobium fredii USDA 205]|uniref:Dephospho-CoA kinase n=1 Tax=Rhizobium fredii TaxID=380 RepID=A0A844AAF2_RHIFR|nr:dephospho-CoA kinase [Sinorhizobium fredii]AWM27016.1 Dephospho-CoA kinase [Sinorhizobium fredii CCBAU 25509]KSV86465.1 dephospho-CoA kinase [Sinorhizobium fredii USDA 205]MQW97708.1 dephospho-CoA kinase [Sinorhizobium fredii]MQX08805.1 dephospho-CoA kinase [Sinorhizobium fredii]UTY51045.1 dephospho-CoA kinase [Sinorhizobium fredii]
MIIVGLTGSIGMGKTTAAQMFRELGVPVNDADEVVHELYRGEAVAPVEAAFPGVAKDGVIDRAELSRQLLAQPQRLGELEQIVHPFVRAKEGEFIAMHKAAEAPFVLLDIPLLFETKAEKRVDRVVVVSCAPEAQRERVMKRPGMTAEKFAMILARQVPDQDKRARADYVIDTSDSFDVTREQVRAIVEELRADRH